MKTIESVAGPSGLWEALNSPFSLLVIGFVFTTILGGVLTNILNRSAQAREIRLKAFARKEEIRLVRLHEDRADAIKLLHDKLVDVEKSLYILLYNWRPIGLVAEYVKPEDVVVAVREFRNKAEKSKVYFNAELASILDSVCEKMESTMSILEGPIMMSGYNLGEDPWERESPDFADNAWEGVHVHLVTAREHLRNQFRDVLGVQ
jgi:hypothetical protein